MDQVIPSKEFRNDFSELVRVDITNIISFFLLAVVCAYVFLEMVYIRYINNSQLKNSLLDYIASFTKKEQLQLVGWH